MAIPHRANAVVTGAGSGFGRAIALELAARGGRVLVSDIEAENVEATARTIRDRGGEAHAIVTDVRDASAVERMAKEARDRFGATDVLVNNAGVAVAGAVGEIPLDDWRWQIDINLYGVIYGCHFFVPAMRAQKRGWVLNVASVAGIVSAPLMGPYNVTKAGVIALSETLATEAAADGVRVSALCPSFFRTDIHKRARANGTLTRTTEKLVTESKWSADDIAKVALEGLAEGRLYILPQTDARAMWRLKRALGNSFFSGLGMLARRGLIPGSASKG